MTKALWTKYFISYHQPTQKSPDVKSRTQEVGRGKVSRLVSGRGGLTGEGWDKRSLEDTYRLTLT